MASAISGRCKFGGSSVVKWRLWRRGFLKKRHQIAVALWVSNGVAMVAAIGLTVVVEWRKIVFFSFEIFATDRLGRVGLTQLSNENGMSSASTNSRASTSGTTRTPVQRRHDQHAQATTTRAPCTSDDSTSTAHQRWHHACEQRMATAAATATDCDGNTVVLFFCCFLSCFFFSV